MQPFEQAVGNAEDKEQMIKDLVKNYGVTEEKARHSVEEGTKGDLWVNDTYTVLAREMQVPNFPDMIWLSIKRNDREVIHDWRDMQKIKNMIVGEENEGVEIYPAESRLVDTANQYHLWVLKDNTIKFPFGFHDGRNVSDETEGKLGKVKQRKF